MVDETTELPLLSAGERGFNFVNNYLNWRNVQIAQKNAPILRVRSAVAADSRPAPPFLRLGTGPFQPEPSLVT